MAKQFDLTELDVEKYETLEPLLNSLLRELKALSNKKQDGLLNPLKVKAINNILIDTKELLKSEPESTYLQQLDDEVLPSYSDAVIICVQYQAAMSNYKKKYANIEFGKTYWQITN